jgi:hypothetical protein
MELWIESVEPNANPSGDGAELAEDYGEGGEGVGGGLGGFGYEG